MANSAITPARRVTAVERSPFYSIMDLAAKRSDCVYLHLGEPDFDTPAHIIAAAEEALRGGWTHYTADRGLPKLRELIAAEIQKETGAEYRFEDEILVTAGGQAALHTAVMGLVNPGDEVILLAPYYPPYLVNVQLAGAVPVVVQTQAKDEFNPDLEAIEAAVTARTKAMIVHSPNNPCGTIYSHKILGSLMELAERHNITIISDEVYDHFIYGAEKHTSPASFPNAKQRLILVNSFSKTYAMTGWRVGYIAAPSDVALQFLKYHHTVNICAAAFAQRACIAALEGPQDCLTEMIEEYDRRRARIVERVNQIPRLSCMMPRGAFYVFVNIEQLSLPSLEFARHLVQEAGVVTANGSGFGAEGYIRLSYAAKIEQIDEALDRIAAVVSRMP